MVKKIVIIVLVIVFSAVSCFGAIVNDGVTPNFITCDDPQSTLVIDNMGRATVSGYLIPKSSSSIDGVTMNFKLDRVSGGTLLNETHNAVWNSTKKGYYLEKNCNLVRNGIYELKVVYKCYEDGRLVETVVGGAVREIY